MALFDRYVMIDWSAASVPTTGRDSIWLGISAHGEDTTVENVPTRAAAVARLVDIGRNAIDAGHRVLMGFDFPFGYPAGVAERITGQSGALALWRWIAERLEDGEDNANNRFAVAAEMNRQYAGTGPFWGRPATVQEPDIPVKASLREGDGHPPERRLVEKRATNAKTVWQLAYAGSVGSQVITGLPTLLRLREDPAVGDATRIWPFETGLCAPLTPITLAEIYPSLIAADLSEKIKDAGQVRAVANWLATLDQKGELEAQFHGPDASAADRSAIANEEAWILGLEAALGGATGTAVVAPLAPKSKALRYERDPETIYRQSFEIVGREARLDHLPKDLHPVAVRLVHACGMPEITARLSWSEDLLSRAVAAMKAGAPILCDCEAVAAMVIRRALPADNPVICTLNEPVVPALAQDIHNTRSAAAVRLWDKNMAGAIVAIGNAPTALFHLLERLDDGAPCPAAILGFPVGFVGAAESKAELARDARGSAFLTLRGRRGGSAMAAAAVNALARIAGEAA